MREPAPVRIRHARVAREHRDRSLEQVVEVEQAALAALELVSAKQAHARVHERRALGVVRGVRPLMEPPQRDQFLLQALEHLQCRRYQIVRPLIPDQRRVAELPHELSGEDPPVRAAHDPEAGGHADAPAVRAKPAQRDRMHRPHRGHIRAGKVLDALPHLLRRAIGEGHDQDRRGVSSRRQQPPESLGDDGGLTGAGAGDDPPRRPQIHAVESGDDRFGIQPQLVR